MPLPVTFLDHLRREGYHPRSDKHSNTLALAIVNDLIEGCEPIRSKAHRGDVVYDLNFDLRVRTATWNVDLVVGKPAVAEVPPVGAQIARAAPATVEIAIEIKSVMTEHRKAVKNRKRDLEAHHEHVHNYSQSAIAGGVFVVNYARSFQSPLRPVITQHASDNRGAGVLVAHCVNELRNVSERSDASGYGLDAKLAMVVSMDNVHLPSTAYVDRQPAPEVGDPLNYDSFLQRVCDQYRQRFP